MGFDLKLTTTSLVRLALLAMLSYTASQVDTTLGKVGTIETNQAVLIERIHNMERRITDLEHRNDN